MIDLELFIKIAPLFSVVLSLIALVVSVHGTRSSRREQRLSRIESIEKNRREFFDYYKEIFLIINKRVDELLDSISSEAHKSDLDIVNYLDTFGKYRKEKAFRHLVNDIINCYCDALLPALSSENGYFGSRKISNIYQLQFLFEDYKPTLKENSLGMSSLYEKGNRGSIIDALLNSKGFHLLVKSFFERLEKPAECFEFVYKITFPTIKNISNIRSELRILKTELEQLIKRNEIEDINLVENQVIYDKIYNLYNKLDFLDNLSNIEYLIEAESDRNDRGDKYTSSAIIMALIYLRTLSLYKSWGNSPSSNLI